MNISSRLANKLSNYDNPQSAGAMLRSKRLDRFCKIIQHCHRQHQEVKILDLGGTVAFWSSLADSFLKENNLSITILNVIDSVNKIEHKELNSRIDVVQGDACSLPQYPDNSFQIVHSNSVIEHVGGWERMKCFAHEVRRLASTYYIQTPYFWFPLEPHFMVPIFHWLPRSWQISLMTRVSLGHCPRAKDVNEAMRHLNGSILLDQQMLENLFPDAIIEKEKVCLLTKSITAVKIDDG